RDADVEHPRRERHDHRADDRRHHDGEHDVRRLLRAGEHPLNGGDERAHGVSPEGRSFFSSATFKMAAAAWYSSSGTSSPTSWWMSVRAKGMSFTMGMPSSRACLRIFKASSSVPL